MNAFEFVAAACGTGLPCIAIFIAAAHRGHFTGDQVQRGGAHPRAIKREPNGGYEGLPVWWAKPYAGFKQCWGCGGDPTTSIDDLQYGWAQGPRPMCDTCIQIIEPILHSLPRPPASLSVHKNPIRIGGKPHKPISNNGLLTVPAAAYNAAGDLWSAGQKLRADLAQQMAEQARLTAKLKQAKQVVFDLRVKHVAELARQMEAARTPAELEQLKIHTDHLRKGTQ